MLRVIYEWRVADEHIPAFYDAWRRTTTLIHQTVKGARGSFFLQKLGEPGAILTIARWDSYAHWQDFFTGADPAQMQQMRSLGERISVTAYDEPEGQPDFD